MKRNYLMKCSVCRIECDFRPRGFCGAYRCRSQRVAARWIRPRYDYHMQRSGITPRQAMLKAERTFVRLSKSFTRRIILLANLDNPYMSEDARRVVINEIRRHREACRGRAKKPVQSVRPNSTRKATAA